MTREELKTLNVPEEFWGNILDLNSRDIGKIKDKFDTVKAENDNLKAQIEESQNTISALESAKNNADKLQEEIDRYKAAEADRKQAEQAAQADATLTQTASEALKDKKFVNEVTKNYYIEELKKAIADKDNAGKSAAELFEVMTRDVAGIFENPHEKIVLDGVSGQWEPSAEGTRTMRAAMGLPPLKGD